MIQEWHFGGIIPIVRTFLLKSLSGIFPYAEQLG